MVKSETRRDAETLVRNPSPRLFGKKFRDSKKVKTNHAKTRLRDLSKTLPRFRDPVKIFRDPRFSRYHSPPLKLEVWKSCSLLTQTYFRSLLFIREKRRPVIHLRSQAERVEIIPVSVPCSFFVFSFSL